MLECSDFIVTYLNTKLVEITRSKSLSFLYPKNEPIFNKISSFTRYFGRSKSNNSPSFEYVLPAMRPTGNKRLASIRPTSYKSR